MPLLPDAHAASLLRYDDAARTVFFPVGEEKSCYVVPDVETEQRIRRQLKRIRFAQLAAWALLPVILVITIAVTDRAGVLIPKWLFVSVVVVTIMAYQLVPEWARRRLARGLAPLAERASKKSLIEKLPAWAAVLMIALAVGLAFYLGQDWPVKAIAWLDDIPHAPQESKALAKLAVFIAGASAVLWGGVGALRMWFRPSGEQANPISTDEKT